jgi:hypothetical protein
MLRMISMMRNTLALSRSFGLLVFLSLLAFGAFGFASPSPAAAQDAVSDLLGRVNSLRASQGLPGYSLNGALNAAAQGHAQWMADSQVISHTGPSGSTPTARAGAAGYPSSFVSENIYGGTNAGANDAWVFWVNSPIHYRGLINSGYTEVGIGVGVSSWGTTYVMVFGSQSNPYAAAARAANGGNGGGDGGGAESAPPSFIVGVDEYGNIMHEMQPEQTLGDVALIYGYTWDDIPTMLALNALTENDIRLIQIGQIFLVPPHAGTYTPTPLPPGVTLTASNTPDPMTPTAEGELGLPGDEQPPPTITPTYDLSILTQIAVAKTQNASTPLSLPTEFVPPQIATAASIPIDLPDYVTTVTPTPDPALMAAGIEATGVQVAQVNNVSSAEGSASSTEGSNQQVIIVRESSASPWLIAAVVLQGLIIVAASIEFFRRLRKK